ncbi:glycosyltransferase family 4 protein [Brachybacterium saurashtrense]|uniref:D-inositol 3-phosphate glycosyltransferase n=1 Tax=Brachybacterium saurashtrense TaxID=556288 RepID=A0A345YQL6_9MICO|nr:glycosyltransferase family 4 protein [Brachybacterium saurashtrense]AXK46218.1 glycosyltransferase [Brachybacterium saurashtrense]RRR23958.1 glycosyltransferase [Brachybacterium saurashtrense]
MRILLLTHYYAPEFGAPQRRWSALVSGFVAAGHRVTVAAPVPHYPAGRPDRRQRRRHPIGAVERGLHGETVLRTAYLPHLGDIGTRTADHLVAALDSLQRLRCRFRRPEHRPDVIIATAPAIPTLLAGRALSALWDVPLVVEMRDAWPDLVSRIDGLGPQEEAAAAPPAGEATPAAAARTVGAATGAATGEATPDEPAPGLRRRLLAPMVAHVKRSVHRHVTHWQTDARAVVTTTGRFAEVLRERGVDPVWVVRNGTDLRSVVPQHDHPDAAQRELRCLYLGNMGRSQGLETVVRAAALLAAEGVALQVRMVGHGVEATELAALAEELGAPVEVLPRIPHREVTSQYAWADTVIVSLRSWVPFTWTVPSKLYEVLATGRHVTALLAGEAADVVREAGAGDVLPPEDLEALTALWRELAAEPSRTAVRPGGRDWAAAHADDDELTRRYLEILARVVPD